MNTRRRLSRRRRPAPRVLSPALDLLVEMHTYRRPFGSATEREFIDRYIANLPGAEQDPYGNWHVFIGDAPIIWSCHTDTVHDRDGRQRVHLSRAGLLTVDRASAATSSCLGADDTAGVFLCRAMVLARRPGHYIFHYGEEVGGLGSNALADYVPALLDGATAAVAFDRKGTGDVITHQLFGRTASDVFAHSLADALNVRGLNYRPDDTGSFTDTANYSETIPECTNLSIGYEHAHTRRESLDTDHVLRLLSALLTLDVDELTIARDPHAIELDIDWIDDAHWRKTDRTRDRAGRGDVNGNMRDDWRRIDTDDDDLWGRADPYLEPQYADVQQALRAYSTNHRFDFTH